MRRSRSPASSCYTASARDSSHWDVWAFKAELHLQSGTRCFRPEVCTAKQQGVLARAGYLQQSRSRKETSGSSGMPPILTAEHVVRRIAAECADVDERGAVGI